MDNSSRVSCRFLLLAVAPSARAASIQRAPNNLGLVGYWSMDDCRGATSTDSSGNGNTGTLTNFELSTTTSNWVSGSLAKIGYALNFDGVDDIVNAGNNASQTGVMTAAAWIFPTTNTTTLARGIITNISGLTANQNYALELGRTAGKLSVIWGGALIGTGNATIPVNQWTHVAMVRSGSSGNWTLPLYINGVLDKTVSNVATNPSGGAYETIVGGYNTATSDWLFKGSIDEVRIYNRALSATEVLNLFNVGMAR